MEGLYMHFRRERPRGLGVAKVSKVLHLKRPAAYPILDSHLMKKYALAARRQGRLLPDRDSRHLHWAAIREDLIDNSAVLAALRQQLSGDVDGASQDLTRLTDLRLLHICTW